MNSKQIVIEIDENGEIKIETLGFTGKGCLEESQWVKDLLGEETSRELKPCYFVTEKSKTKVTKHLPICG